MQAMFKFVDFIAATLNTFLKGFQTDQPMVPFLTDVLEGAMTSLLGMFILKLLKIDTTNRNISQMNQLILQGVSQKFPIWVVRHKLGISELWSRGVWRPTLKAPNGIWGKAPNFFCYLTHKVLELI